MNSELDAAICKEFPTLYRDRNGDMRTTCMCWGLEVGDGWANIIRALSAGLANATESHTSGGAAKAADGHFECGFTIIASQVKEKYGTLRFYYHAETKPGVAPEAVDDEYAREVAGEIRGLIEMAERMSAITCEACGAPGRLNRGGWLSVRCAACREHEDLDWRVPRWLPERWRRAYTWIYARLTRYQPYEPDDEDAP